MSLFCATRWLWRFGNPTGFRLPELGSRILGSIDKFYETGFALHKFFGKRTVSGGTHAVWLVLDNRFAETWRFSQADGSGNDRLIHQAWKVLPDFVDHLLTEICSCVVHGHDNAAYEKGVVEGANLIDELNNF